MKTRLALLITMALLAIGLTVPAHAASPFEYTVSNGEATITGYNGAPTPNLAIPAEIADGDHTYTVTTIGRNAFYKKQLTELTLPNSLTTIGDTAFSNNLLTKLTLPDSLTTISNAAFYGNQLTELDLPDTITTIGGAAFRGNRLTALTLPDTITTIGGLAFGNNKLTELTLPNAITTITDYSFYDNQLTELVVPATVTSIGSMAFTSNPDLDNVRFAGAAPTLGTDALGTSNPTVRFPWRFGDPRTAGGYTTPTWHGFRTIPVATVIFVSRGNIPTQSVDVDGTAIAAKPADPVKAGHKFMGWFTGTATTHFDFNTPVTGDLTLTPDFDAALVLTGPQTSAVKLGDAFTWTPTTLTGEPTPTVTATGLPDGLEIDSETGIISGTVTDPAETGDHPVTITAANGIDPDTTFDLTISIEYFTYSIAEGEATITGYHGPVPAELEIPAEVTDGDDTYPVTAIGNNALRDNQLTGLTLPDGLTTIGAAAFYNNQLTELTLPNTLTTISNSAFAYNQLTELTLPKALTGIGDFAFQNNQLTELTLPTTLTGIGDFAFQNNQLTGLTLPDTLAAIGVYAFQNNQLTELTLPDSLTTIGEAVFQNNRLTELTLPNTLTTIGNWAFHGNRLTELTLPNTLTTVSDYAFAENQLTELTLPNALTTIGDSAFTQNQLTELTLPNALTTIDGMAFAGNQLTELTLPDSLTTISYAAFAGNQLTKLTLPNTLTTIGGMAFAGNQLPDLSIPDMVTTIDGYAFYDNPLTNVVVGSAVSSIGDSAFGTQVTAARFTGKAPGMGVDALGTSDPSVRFPWKFDEQRAPGGYTTPSWKGYDTIAFADVTFAGGDEVTTQSIDIDDTAVKPADPAKAGHVFTGWFADAATTPFDFATPITGDVILTAGFEPAAVPGPGTPSPGIPVPADPAISGLDPAITGNAREGKTLTAKPGNVTPSDATVTYQWLANGKVIKGAKSSSLKLRKAQAGKRITVTITAKATGAPTVSKTSAKTKPVSSAKRRLVLSTYSVGKNKPVTVTATGFKARQKIIIWLGGDNRYTGRADSRGVITKTVTFAKDTKAGTRRVRVSGYQNDGGRNRTIHTTVKYR